jgi:hypothetical protein
MKDLIQHPISVVFFLLFVVFSFYSLTTNVNGEYGYITIPDWSLPLPAGVFALTLAFYLGKLDGNDSKISHHWLRFVVRGVLLAIFPLLLLSQVPFFKFYFFEAALFWPVFNISFNYFKARRLNKVFDWAYIGKTAAIDKFLHEIQAGPGFLILAYTSLIIISIILLLP